MKEKIDLIRTRSYDPMLTSPVWYHRAREPYDVPLLIYDI
jgi:hypothetical protein